MNSELFERDRLLYREIVISFNDLVSYLIHVRESCFSFLAFFLFINFFLKYEVSLQYVSKIFNLRSILSNDLLKNSDIFSKDYSIF